MPGWYGKSWVKSKTLIVVGTSQGPLQKLESSFISSQTPSNWILLYRTLSISDQYWEAWGWKKSTKAVFPGQTYPMKFSPSASLTNTFLFNPYWYADPLSFIPASIIGIYLYFSCIFAMSLKGKRPSSIVKSSKSFM